MTEQPKPRISIEDAVNLAHQFEAEGERRNREDLVSHLVDSGFEEIKPESFTGEPEPGAAIQPDGVVVPRDIASEIADWLEEHAGFLSEAGRKSDIPSLNRAASNEASRISQVAHSIRNEW